MFTLTVTNNTDKDLRRIGTMTDTTGSFSYPLAGEVGPGETFETAVAPGSLADPGGGSIDGIMVWAELDTPDSKLFAVSDTQSFGYGALAAPLALTATTGLTAGSACAADGGVADRTVTPGTPVHLCYTLTNTSGLTFHVHDLDDSALGSRVESRPNAAPGFENDLGTGETMTWSAAQPIVATASATHTGTWSSMLADDDYNGMPEDYVATATASATVTVQAPSTTTTTEPTTTTTTAVRPTPAAAVPAVAVVATPRMAG